MQYAPMLLRISDCVCDIILAMDIKAGINTAIFLAVIGVLISLWIGFRSIQSGWRLVYFRLRQQRIAFGWRMIFFALGLAVLVVLLGRFGEPVIYSFYEPSPSPSLSPTLTLSPTITITPTITLTPTITDTPSVTDTPTVTPTPAIPLAILSKFESNIAPDPAVVFSPLSFGRDLDLKTYTLIDPATSFKNPVRRIDALFSYDKMTTGVQWTALWYRDGQLIFYETNPWKDSAGGYGYTERIAAPEEWLPGNYEVQIFVGQEWVTVGRFVVEGLAPTSTAAPRPLNSPTARATLQPTATHAPTRTSRPSDTPWPSATP
jgi:hypothetical protein